MEQIVDAGFKIFLEEGAQLPVSPELAEAIEKTVNKITKDKMIIQLDHPANTYLVRQGSGHIKALLEEADNFLIRNVAYISLKRHDSKKITFSVWTKLKQSSVLN